MTKREGTMIRLSSRWALPVLLLSLWGCNARQEAPVEPQQAAEISKKVKVYQSEELRSVKYTSLGPVDASACKWMVWDKAPSEEEVTDQLLRKAMAMDADGVINLSCRSGTAAALVRDCWSRVECTAEAMRIIGGSQPIH